MEKKTVKVTKETTRSVSHTDTSTKSIVKCKRTYTLSLPVSGSKFPNEIALVKYLLRCGYNPDIILGASGGSFTGILCIICDIRSVKSQESYHTFCTRLNMVLSEIDSSWYMKPWSEYSLINSIIAMGKGSLYDRGDAAKLRKNIPISLEGQPEMWIGTHCYNNAQCQLFCTKSSKESILHVDGAKYTHGNLDILTEACIASCSVPMVVPAIPIQGKHYADGGVSYASPLGPCMKAYDNGDASYHVVYISPTRFNSKDDPDTDEIEDDDIKNKIKSAFAGMVTELHIADRNNGIRAVGSDVKKTTGRGVNALVEALTIQSKSQRSFIELAPTDTVHMNFLNMKKGDARTAVQKAYKNEFTVRHWYI